jgi:hypothetical protein
MADVILVGSRGPGKDASLLRYFEAFMREHPDTEVTICDLKAEVTDE